MSKATYFRRYWQLYALLSLPIIYFLIFRYGPMYGVQIAFKDFNLFQGIGGSEWIGFDAFREVFGMREFYTTLRNTFMLNFLDLLVSFPAPIILTIMLFEIRSVWFKKISQTILYIPTLFMGDHRGIVYQLFGNQSGMVNGVLESLGLTPIPFLTEKIRG